MRKLLTICLGLGLFGQQAFAVTTETVTGRSFAGYANSVLATNGTFMTDLGNNSAGSDWSSTAADINARLTDTSAGTNIVGTSDNASIDLGFSSPFFDGSGNDLELFFVGNNGHRFDVTVGGVTQSYSLPFGANSTTSSDPAYPTDPIIALGIDLATFGGLSGSFNSIRVTVGNGYCDSPVTPRPLSCPDSGPSSAVLSFVGTNNVTVVPVPAAVWLFGSGLLGLAGVVRKRA